MKKFLLSLALVLLSGAAMAQGVIYQRNATTYSADQLNALTEATMIAVKNLSGTNNRYLAANANIAEFGYEAVLVWEPAEGNTPGKYHLRRLSEGENGYIQAAASGAVTLGAKATAQVFVAITPNAPGNETLNGDNNGILVRFKQDGANTWLNCQSAANTPILGNTGQGGYTMHNVYGVDEVPAVSVSYVYKVNGETMKTVTVEQAIGSEFNAPAFPFVSFENPEGNVTAGTNEVEVTCTVALPFEAASSYSNISQWYNLQIRDNDFTYLQYDAAKSYIPASQSAAPTSFNKNSYAWAFVGNPFDGFEIVNYEAGETKVLSSPSAPTGNKNAGQIARMVVKNEATGNTTWRIEPATHANAVANTFYVVHPDNTTYAFNRQSYNSENSLCYWDGRDTGSALKVEECEIATLSDKLVAIVNDAATLFGQIEVGEGLGEYSSSYDNYEAIYNEIAAYSQNIPAGATDEELEIRIVTVQTIMASFSLNMPEAGTFLRLKNHQSGWYASSDLRTGEADHKDKFYMLENGTTASTVWYLTADNKLMSFTKGQYLGDLSQDWSYEAVGSTGNTVEFKESGVLGKYQILPSSGRALYGDKIRVDAAGSGNNTGNYAWTIEEVTSLPVTITEAGYATFFAPVAVQVEGITANTVAVNGEWATLNAIEGGVVPANTGVILSGNAGTYNLAITETAAIIDSGLEGTVAATYVEGPAYVLSNKDGVVGLYKAELNKSAEGAEGETHFLNNGFKAYLVAETPAPVLKFNFGGNTTAIETVLNNGVDANAPIYDLSGRRVKAATKGIYIQNGKKVLVK